MHRECWVGLGPAAEANRTARPCPDGPFFDGFEFRSSPMARMIDRLIGPPNPAPLPRADLLPRENFSKIAAAPMPRAGADGHLDLRQGNGL